VSFVVLFDADVLYPSDLLIRIAQWPIRQTEDHRDLQRHRRGQPGHTKWSDQILDEVQGHLRESGREGVRPADRQFLAETARDRG